MMESLAQTALQSWPLAVVLVALIIAASVRYLIRRMDASDNTRREFEYRLQRLEGPRPIDPEIG